MPINRLLLHTAFWALTFGVMLKLIADDISPTYSDCLYTGILLAPIMLLAYVNGLVLLPRWFSKRQFAGYAIASSASILLFSLLTYAIFEKLLDAVYPSFIFVSLFSFFDLVLIGTTTVAITSLLYFTISWFNAEQERKEIAIQLQQKSDAELKLLKSQLNPHFLFNALNSIYALVLRKSDVAADALVQLSDIIRYMVYETGSGTISLRREIEILQNYIELQKMRLNADVEVSYRQLGDVGEKQIAPMLLFPFVENAFKHGSKGMIKDSFVRINVDVEDESVTLGVYNSKGAAPSVNDKNGGVGLANVKQLLERIYPDSYKLTIEDAESTFHVNLTIKF